MNRKQNMHSILSLSPSQLFEGKNRKHFKVSAEITLIID